jgi:hypothetical protein
LTLRCVTLAVLAVTMTGVDDVLPSVETWIATGMAFAKTAPSY